MIFLFDKGKAIKLDNDDDLSVALMILFDLAGNE
jgi:hypothetical protein